MGTFMIIMFLVGLVLTIYAFKISNSILNCNEHPSVQSAVKGLIVLGIMLLSISATYMVCGCSANIHNKTIGMGFVILMFIISIVIIGLISTIYNGCKEARSELPVLLGMSALSTVISGIYLVSKIISLNIEYKNSNNNTQKSTKQKSTKQKSTKQKSTKQKSEPPPLPKTLPPTLEQSPPILEQSPPTLEQSPPPSSFRFGKRGKKSMFSSSF